MDKIVTKTGEAYDILLNNISNLWTEAKEKAVVAINTELIDANWNTGRYIIEYE